MPMEYPVPDPLDVEQAFINSDRPERLVSDKTITIDAAGGEDYTSIQTALDNELPLEVGESATIKFDVKAGTYAEDVVIESVKGHRNQNVLLEGDPATPSNVVVDTITVAGCSAQVQVNGFEVTSESTPYQPDENTAITSYMSGWVTFKNINFRNSTHGAVAYGSNGETAFAGDIDFGTDVLSGRAFIVKHGGYICTKNATSLTGSVGNQVYDLPNGFVLYDSSHALSGGLGTIRKGGGQAFDVNDVQLRGMDMLEPNIRVPEHIYLNSGVDNYEDALVINGNYSTIRNNNPNRNLVFKSHRKLPRNIHGRLGRKLSDQTKGLRAVLI